MKKNQIKRVALMLLCCFVINGTALAVESDSGTAINTQNVEKGSPESANQGIETNKGQELDVGRALQNKDNLNIDKGTPTNNVNVDRGTPTSDVKTDRHRHNHNEVHYEYRNDIGAVFWGEFFKIVFDAVKLAWIAGAFDDKNKIQYNPETGEPTPESQERINDKFWTSDTFELNAGFHGNEQIDGAKLEFAIKTNPIGFEYNVSSYSNRKDLDKSYLTMWDMAVSATIIDSDSFKFRGIMGYNYISDTNTNNGFKVGLKSELRLRPFKPYVNFAYVIKERPISEVEIGTKIKISLLQFKLGYKQWNSSNINIGGPEILIGVNF